jgi:DNA repair exonuclease SbcCD nuclease subunit
LHTSDVHVGAEDARLEGLRGAVDAALEDAVDAVLIAGDLFDSSIVPGAAVDVAIAELSRVSCPVVVIPGNHDCLDEDSIYHRVDLRAAGDHVVFVGERAGRSLIFPDLALAVWARGIEQHDPDHRPLSGYQPVAEPGYWQIVVTHGHYVPTGRAPGRSSPISQGEIASLACDYVALGHWHGFADVSHGSTRACYSGSPSEPVGGGYTVNIVTLDHERGVEVEQRAVGRERRAAPTGRPGGHS